MPLAVWSVALVISNGIRSAGMKKKTFLAWSHPCAVDILSFFLCFLFTCYASLFLSLPVSVSLSLSQDKERERERERLMKFKIVLDFI